MMNAAYVVVMVLLMVPVTVLETLMLVVVAAKLGHPVVIMPVALL